MSNGSGAGKHPVGERRVGGGLDELRVSQQVDALDAGCRVVAFEVVEVAVDDVVLEDLVDEVDVRERDVGVLAAEQQVLQVGPAGEQHVDRVRPVVRDVGQVEELEQLDEVGGRAEHRLAVLTGAEVEVVEQRLERRRGGDVVRQRRLGDAVASAGQNVDRRQVRLRDVAGDEVERRARARSATCGR